MMLDSPLLIRGSWQISGLGIGCGENSRQRGSSRSRKVIPTSYKDSSKSNLEANVVWPKTVLVSLWKTLNLNNSSDLPIPTSPTTLNAPPAPAEASGYSLILGMCLPCPRYSRQAKITSRWGSLGVVTGGCMLSLLFAGPIKIKRVIALVNTGDECAQYMVTLRMIYMQQYKSISHTCWLRKAKTQKNCTLAR